MNRAGNDKPDQTGDFLRTERRGALGLITLNRPKALNALSEDMITGLAAALDQWENDNAVEQVAIQSASDRAFCAGGDIRSVAEASRHAQLTGGPAPTDFFRAEYRLNYRIKHYPKPFIALINGIVMGGGVGISIHGRYRVVCEDLRFAMPEVGIGFFPDVGGTYVLPRLKEKAGLYLALTGLPIGWRDSLDLGLATHTAKRDLFPGVIDQLAEGEEAASVLSSLEPLKNDDSAQLPSADTLSKVFDSEDLGSIVAAITSEASTGEEWAIRAQKAILRASPTSLKLAHEQMRRGGSLDFAEAMTTEFRIVSRILMEHDFYEGVRALIIDKDKSPVWLPNELDAVSEESIDAYFSPLERELSLT